MQLFEHRFQLVGDRQAEVSGVLQDRETVVGNGPEDDGGTQDARLVQDVRVQDLGDAHQQECQHLAAEAAEAYSRAELMILNGAHDAGEIVHDHKHQQGIKQAVASAQEVAEPCADCSESGLDDSPIITHRFSSFNDNECGM